jgi:hypothetical protein
MVLVCIVGCPFLGHTLANANLAGGAYGTTRLQDLSINELRESMIVNFESNFCKSFYKP